jgi:hypothetical protein
MLTNGKGRNTEGMRRMWKQEMWIVHRGGGNDKKRMRKYEKSGTMSGTTTGE